MLSYKKWKKINENFNTNLGVSAPNKINTLHSKWDEGVYSKKSKKMFGGGDMGGGDMGGDDMGGGMPKLPMKKKKPPMSPEIEDDEDSIEGDEADIDNDEDNIEGDEDLGDESDLGDDEADLGDDEADLGDDEGKLGNDMGKPMPKKKNNFVDKTKAVADGAMMMHKGAKKMSKGMKESNDKDAEFFRSLQSQTGSTFFTKDTDGSWSPVSEDAVIAPNDPNADIIDEDEPGPGEVGYAPQGRVGFSEWSEKFKRKKK